MKKKNNLDKCSLCNKVNKHQLMLSSDTWISKIQIRFIYSDVLIDELSICPKCRIKYTIQDLYMRPLSKR